ncbi:MAG: hypothetical protein V3U92_13570 [Cellulophaga sp.]
MKNFISGLCILVLFSCQTTNTSAEAEEEAIKAAITGETKAYMEKDYKKWASFWDHSKDVLRLDVTKSGFEQKRGWENNGKNWGTFFKENPEPITSIFANSNYLILHDKHLSWVAFDQTWTTESGEITTAKATITLVKKSDSWKIISYTAIQHQLEESIENSMGRE